MKIHNLRLGFACNSSSSHSLIFLKGTTGELEDSQDFGWSDFTLACHSAKMGYLGQQIVTSLRHQLGAEPATALAMAIVGVDLDPDGYVDHQSAWTLPTTWDGSTVDTDFLCALRDFLEQDGVVVLGGNDNSDGHPLSYKGADDDPVPGRSPLDVFGRFRDGAGRLIARHDPALGLWTLFDRDSGAKVRFSFELEDGGPPAQPTIDSAKAIAPELVDVKVTDLCPYECRHCYQGSDRSGAHADRAFLEEVLDDLAACRVFEVAYGGGEPTAYPDFLGLLRATRERNVVPNFTTRNLGFLQKHVKRLKELVGRVAFSVDFDSEIDRLELYLTERKDDDANIFSERNSSWESFLTVQHVVGSTPQAQLERLLKLCRASHVSVTLLGWKDVGRGMDAARHGVDWRKAIEAAELYSVSVDTALARSSDMSGVDTRTYHTSEGSVSCYVDAVQRRVGPSSYAGSLLMRPYTSMSEDWKRVRVERGVAA